MTILEGILSLLYYSSGASGHKPAVKDLEDMLDALDEGDLEE